MLSDTVCNRDSLLGFVKRSFPARSRSRKLWIQLQIVIFLELTIRVSKQMMSTTAFLLSVATQC